MWYGMSEGVGHDAREGFTDHTLTGIVGCTEHLNCPKCGGKPLKDFKEGNNVVRFAF